MDKTDFKARAKALVSQMTLAEKISQMLHEAPAIERLGVKEYNWWNEGLHGVARAGVATVFPQAIGIAATFDTELMHNVANVISTEARAKYNEFVKFGYTQIYQGLTYWSPNVNIFRDPRWGRGHETYGEDPFLTGSMGAAFIKGLQGDHPVYKKLDATVKHYAVHSGPEAERHRFNAICNQQDLYETYLSAFKYCIEKARPSAVMGAYNRTNGEACCASKTLIGDILYGEFGFDGYYVSDCGAICLIDEEHHLTNNHAESAALAVNNGCTLNCGGAYQYLKAAVAENLITEETITEAVERLFEARFRLGMFDEDCPYDSIPYELNDCEEHNQLAVKTAEDCMVLLKNDGILPLKDDLKTIAVIGPNADNPLVLLGNYHGVASKKITILNGIQQLAGENTRVLYARGCRPFGDEDPDTIRDGIPLNEAIIAAKKADVVILCMGLTPEIEGEMADKFNGTDSGDKETLKLSKLQLQLYEEIKKTGKPIVFLHVSGSAMLLNDMQDESNAVAQIWYMGGRGGLGVANLLFGKANFSGRLPVTFYKTEEELPPPEDYNMDGRTYKFMKTEPLYPFGFGLSYTTFAFSDLKIELGDNGLTAAATITNTGTKEGATVPQLYTKRTVEGLRTPNLELKAFTKLTLQPGEAKAVSLYIEKDRLAVINNDGKSVHLPGELTLLLSDSQPIERSQELGAANILTETIVLP